MKKFWICLPMAILLATTALVAQTTTYSFEGVESIAIRTVRGDIVITESSSAKTEVEFVNNLNHPEKVEPEVTFADGNLTIEEVLARDEKVKGHIEWVIYVPEDVIRSLDCSSIDGDIEFDEVQLGDARLETATGDVCLVSTHTLALSVTTSSGGIRGKDILSSDILRCATSDGTVDVRLADVPTRELHLASTTGEVKLRVDFFPPDFELTATANEGRGDFSIPFDCTSSESGRMNEHDTYDAERCTVIKGAGGPPRIDLLTGDGKVKVSVSRRGLR